MNIAENVEFQAQNVPVTAEQYKALEELAKRWNRIHVGNGTFDLPRGYITVRLFYKDGTSIYGGISPEGQVST
jgi:hypothetical protein